MIGILVVLKNLLDMDYARQARLKFVGKSFPAKFFIDKDPFDWDPHPWQRKAEPGASHTIGGLKCLWAASKLAAMKGQALRRILQVIAELEAECLL